MIKKAITHLKLDHTNKGKKKKLESVVAEYMRTTEAYVDFMIQRKMKEPDKFASIPEADVPTKLSKRWQRCAWQQACGIVKSWYSNECANPPVLRNICIQAVVCSATAGLELHVVSLRDLNDMPKGKGLPPTVNQPSQHLCLE